MPEKKGRTVKSQQDPAICCPAELFWQTWTHIELCPGLSEEVARQTPGSPEKFSSSTQMIMGRISGQEKNVNSLYFNYKG